MTRDLDVSTTDGRGPALSAGNLTELNDRFKDAKPEALLRWTIDTFSPRLGLASSFGAEDVVLIDMLSRLEPLTRIFTLDTGRLPAETYALMEAVRDRYGVSIEVDRKSVV